MANATVTKTEILNASGQLQQALAHDDFTGVSLNAEKLQPIVKQWISDEALKAPLLQFANMILTGAEKLASTTEEQAQRKAFGTLSAGVVAIVRNDKTLQAQYQLYHCPMVNDYSYWTQLKSERMENPYMGLKMLQCGSKVAWNGLL
jgi:hypothetical protein